jgi:hypothetical protein
MPYFRTMAIDFLVSFNFTDVFNFHVFPFPSSKAQFLGDVPMNGQNAANISPLVLNNFSFLCNGGR